MSVSDIFKGPANVSFDLMRVGGFSAFVLFPLPYIYTVFHKGAVPDPVAFGTGYALVIAAIAGAIGGKDIAVAKANATAAQSGQT